MVADRGEESSERTGSGRLGLLALSSTLVVYFVILWVLRHAPAPIGGWLVLFVPNMVLIGASLLWVGRSTAPAPSLSGGRRVVGGLVITMVFAALVVAAAWFWPERPTAHGGAIAFIEGLVLITLVPLAEEVFFRGVLLDELKRWLGPHWGAGMVSIVFGVLHLPQGTAFPMFLLSLAACVLALRAKSLLWSIALHVGWNALAFTCTRLIGNLQWYLAGTAVALLLGLASWGWRTRLVRARVRATEVETS